jgi:AcrR family transcriptional regulator
VAKQDEQAAADDAVPPPLWFAPPVDDRDRRRTLTRERVVAEALTVIGADGVDALSMRLLATPLGVVPGALYRHVRNRDQLHDLVLDEVLAQVDCELDRSLPWTERVKLLAHRLGTVLQDRPGIAALLKTRDPLGPHSLALAEAFLATLQAAGLPKHETGLAFSLVYDYSSDSRSAARPPSTSSASAIPQPETVSTRSFNPCRPTASPRSSTSAKPSGSTTATNASPRASTPSSTDSQPHDAGTDAAAPGKPQRRR